MRNLAAFTRTTVALGLFAALVAGCGGPPPITQMEAPTETAPSVVSTEAVEPTSPQQDTSSTVDAGAPGSESGLLADCIALSEPLQETVQVAVTTAEAPLEDVVSGKTLHGCQLSASWTGEHMADFAAVSLQVTALLLERGWQPDERYLADGPTGTAAGFTMADKLALLRVEWKAAPEVACPDDQPITACELLPEQQLFTLTLNIAPTTQ